MLIADGLATLVRGPIVGPTGLLPSVKRVRPPTPVVPLLLDPLYSRRFLLRRQRAVSGQLGEPDSRNSRRVELLRAEGRVAFKLPLETANGMPPDTLASVLLMRLSILRRDAADWADCLPPLDRRRELQRMATLPVRRQMPSGRRAGPRGAGSRVCLARRPISVHSCVFRVVGGRAEQAEEGLRRPVLARVDQHAGAQRVRRGPSLSR